MSIYATEGEQEQPIGPHKRGARHCCPPPLSSGSIHPQLNHRMPFRRFGPVRFTTTQRPRHPQAAATQRDCATKQYWRINARQTRQHRLAAHAHRSPEEGREGGDRVLRPCCLAAENKEKRRKLSSQRRAARTLSVPARAPLRPRFPRLASPPLRRRRDGVGEHGAHVVRLLRPSWSSSALASPARSPAADAADGRAARRSPPPPLPQYAVSATTYAFALHVTGRQPTGGGGGLNPAAVVAFPTGAFSGGRRGSGASDSSDADAQCVVCLTEYKDKDVLCFLPHCGHNFHMACIDLWLEQNSTCPVCRISLRDNLDNNHIAPPPPPSVVISPPCSPEASGSDPCRCLFVSTGHSSRPSEVPRHEPDQENQIASSPSVDGAANNLPVSEVSSPPENNNQTVRLFSAMDCHPGLHFNNQRGNSKARFGGRRC